MHGVNFYCVQGDTEEVPAYLRFEGQVKKRHFRKKETLQLIKDVWKEKIIHDQNVRRSTLPTI